MFLLLEFPSGRFYGAVGEDPTVPEWPPHPSRVYSAFVASAYRSGTGMTNERYAALEWFEQLSAPAISAPDADLSNALTVYLPPGDISARKGKKGEEQYEHGVHRWRQPRYFPSAVILGDPIIVYDWGNDVDQHGKNHLKTLAEIARGITHIGTSHSMVRVELLPGKSSHPHTLIPVSEGHTYLRTTIKGRLIELDAIYKQSSGVRRPSAIYEVLSPYRRTVTLRGSQRSRAGDNLVVLRLTGSMHSAANSAYIGKAVRRAVMSALGDSASGAVHGHSEEDHIGWLALPDVGHAYARGKIVGIGIAFPESCTMNVRQQVLAAVGALDGVRLPDGRKACLVPPRPGERQPNALMTETWTRPSDQWATVTPVVLDRPPKRTTQDRIEKAITDSLQFAGYPCPVEVSVSSFSCFIGAPPAFRVPSSDRKPRFHAIVRFAFPVAGPVIAGRLRYFGIGLFRPIPSLQHSLDKQSPDKA